VLHTATKLSGKNGTSVFTVKTERRHILDIFGEGVKDGKARRRLQATDDTENLILEFQRIMFY
jgi:hypothetical protein